MDRSELAGFLRFRREKLQPEDVGLRRGVRRRTPGLRREEVAELAGMSADYYARLERGAGPQPSEQMIAALARGLRLSLPERDHLFALAGHRTPRRTLRSDHVSPGMMRILDRLTDTPAQVMGPVGETLIQTDLARALLGEQTAYTGPARSAVYRWFTDPFARFIYPAEDHPAHSRVYTAQLRRAVTQHGPGSPAAAIADRLHASSAEFSALWQTHDITAAYRAPKRFIHPQIGDLELDCQILVDPDQDHTLLVFTAAPTTESYRQLQLLAVIGDQKIGVPSDE